jgi:hypothetical protein
LQILRVIVASVVASLLVYVGVSAQYGPLLAQAPQQQAQNSPQEAKPDQSKSQPQTPATPGPAIPSDQKLATLIFSTLIALNQANATGNYSVLRDMGAPGFQTANSAARIAEAFANLRQRNLDLSPILLFQPKLLRKPVLDAQGRLRVTGFFQTRPEQVNFDLIFELVGGQWRLFGMAVDTRQAAPPAASAEQPAPAEANKPAPAAKTKPASASPALPDPRDRVEKLEISPAPETKAKPEESYNPFGGF